MKDKSSVLDDLATVSERERVWKAPSTKRIVTGGTIMTTADIASSIFFTLFLMVVSRSSLEEASLVAVVDTFSVTLRIFATLGFVGAGAKFLSEYLARDKEQARKYLASASKYNFLFTGAPVVAIAVALAVAIPQTPKEREAYAFLVAITALDRLRSCSDIVLLGYQRYDLYTWAFFVPYAASYAVALVAFPSFGAIGALASFAAARALMLSLSLLAARKVSDFPLSTLFAWRKEHGLFRKLVGFNLLYSLANLAFSLLTTTLLITLGKIWALLTPQEIVALYALSTSANVLINVFEVVAPVQQSISEAHALRNPRLLRNYVLVCVKFPILMSVAVITFLLVFREEIVTILFGGRWVTVSVIVFATLPPAYAFGSFASRYDNILAGVGRPETVIFPWFVALGVAIVGLWFGTYLPDAYLVDSFWADPATGETINLGISVKLVYALVVLNASLLVAGLVIVWICLKVLSVEVPRGYVLKPALAAATSAGVLLLLTEGLDVKAFFSLVLPGLAGEATYLVALVLLGVLVFLAFSCAFGAFDAADGRFWKAVVDHMGPLRVLMKPVFWFGKQCLKLTLPRLKSEPVEWVLDTSRDELVAGALFQFDAELAEGEGDDDGGGRRVVVTGALREVKADLHDVHVRVDVGSGGGRKRDAFVRKEIVRAGEVFEFAITLSFEPSARRGDILAAVEAFDGPAKEEHQREDRGETSSGMKRWLSKCFDFRMKWFAEVRLP